MNTVRISTKLENIKKKKQFDLKNTIAKIKNAPERIHDKSR